MRRRVVVTGIGVVTPVGNNVEAMWNVLRHSGSGIGLITHFDASR
ncbi:MAG: beta-ketoacyl synthase N-terminal-like domain-containing protein, partial [Planctomycetaceae bacterium]